MVRISIQHINKAGAPMFPAKVTRVYVKENIKDAAQAGIVERFTDKNPHRKVLRWFGDEIARHDMEPGGRIVLP